MACRLRFDFFGVKTDDEEVSPSSSFIDVPLGPKDVRSEERFFIFEEEARLERDGRMTVDADSGGSRQPARLMGVR